MSEKIKTVCKKIRLVSYIVFSAFFILFILFPGQMVIIRLIVVAVFMFLIISDNVKRDESKEYLAGSIIKTLICIPGLIIAFVIQFAWPSIINSRVPGQYRFSKMYTEYYFKTILLPDSLPENVEDYCFYMFPGFMQVDSAIQINFKTDRKGIEKITKFAENAAAGKVDLELYRQDENNPQIKSFRKRYFEENTNGYIKIITGNAGEEPGDGDIYIIESNGNSNHPHTQSIIINRDKNIVTFTR